MPAAETTGVTGVKRSTKLLQLLFWSGVGLSPLAALLLLVGSGFVLQVAAVLAVLVVLLIGLSIALRRDSEAVRGDVEELVYEEIDNLREDIRGDITHAARATHGQLVERIGVLHETVDALRNQVDMMRGQIERAAAQPPPAPHPGASAAVPQGVLRHTETVQVTTKTMVVDPTEARSGTVYGAPPAGGRPDIPQQRRPDRSERVSARPDERERPRGFDRPDERERPRSSDRPDERERSRGYDRPERTGRTERSEWVERSERSERSEWVERGSRDSSRASRDRSRDDSGEQSWTEQLLRERMARQESGDWPQHRPGGADVERRGGGRRRAPEPEDEDGVTGMRTTDRWAEVHSDERGGRELRMGERREAVHADETGTHVRIEDRWASVRYEDEPSTGGHRAAIESSASSDRRAGRHGSDDDRDEERYDQRRDPRYDSGTESPRRSEARRERERDYAQRDIEMSDGGGRRRADAHWSETSYEEARRDESGGTQWSEVRRSERPALGSTQAALPASPAEPASRWTSGMSTGSSGREHAGSSSSGREYGSGSSSGAGSSSGGREYGGREYGGGREDERGSRR
ncbi:MAG TPA: hypothetical protein VL738_39000, partial [Dactylosporangium sp.]|nr:hypothetical protein [Dactylosporangium sp.]